MQVQQKHAYWTTALVAVKSSLSMQNIGYIKPSKRIVFIMQIMQNLFTHGRR